ncbi:unnamed protein product [Rhizophagus irregularis]|nr:unnamed protein product [Rhizophagus irregularis]CAB5373321.1 unnamed protein product [Rhizophagus irregularis]
MSSILSNSVKSVNTSNSSNNSDSSSTEIINIHQCFEIFGFDFTDESIIDSSGSDREDEEPRKQRGECRLQYAANEYCFESSPPSSSPTSTTKRGDHYFFNFNDIIIYANSNDLLNLLIGLTQRKQRTFLSININAFGKKFDDIEWNIESNKMKCQPNAGGGSFLSEIFSCEIITRILDVQLFKTEMEIKYFFINRPMTDYLINFRHPYNLTLGVSVTRAYAHKRKFTKFDAYRLLTKKLAGINSSTKNITNARIWKQILHIWCPSGKVAKVVKKVYNKLDEKLKSNTVVIVTIVNCKWVFTNIR